VEKGGVGRAERGARKERGDKERRGEWGGRGEVVEEVGVEKRGRGMWYNRDMAYIRKFRTTSGATGVQVCYKEGKRVVKTVHIGSAETEKGVEKLLKKARAVMDGDKTPLFRLADFDKKEE